MGTARIMVVEDEFITAQDIKTGLEAMGYGVDSPITSGEEAVAAAEKERPDLVLMDIVLRGRMDGIDAAGLIRDRLHIPVIFITAHADGPMLERAKATEPFGYLLKPFTHKDLQSTIEIVLYKAEMEKKLRENERRFQLMAENVKDVIYHYRLKPSQGFEFISPSVETIIGYSSREFYENPDFIWKIIHPDDHHLLKAALKPSGRYDQPLRFRWIRKDGIVIWTEQKDTPIFDNSGKVKAIEGIMRDITLQKKAEKNLKVSHQFLQIANRQTGLKSLLDEFAKEIKILTECAAVGVRIVERDGEIPFQVQKGFNREFRKLPCASSNPPATCLCINVIFNKRDLPDSHTTEFGSFSVNKWTALVARENASSENSLQFPCSRCGFESMALIPIRSGERSLGMIQVADFKKNMVPADMIAILENCSLQMGTAILRVRAEDELKQAYRQLEKMVRDRTAKLIVANVKLKLEVEERRAAEDKLLLSKSMLQAVFDGIPEPLILVDKAMRVKMVNQSAASYYNISGIQESLGRKCFETSGKQDLCEDCDIPSAVLKEQPLVFERSSFMNPNRIELVSIYPVKDKTSSAGDAIIRVSDITEERRIENQLIQSEKMVSLGVLVSSIAHEINNPNNFVTFNIPILRDYIDALITIADKYADANPEFELFNMSYPDFREDIIKLLVNIEHGSGRISAFVSNLREFAQQKVTKSNRWVDPKAVIEKVLSICGSKIRSGVKNFSIENPDNLGAIYADPLALEQVLINILVNAAQAADKKESWVKLHISTGRAPDDHTIIEVSDNGCGMDAETRRSVFDPFFTTKSPADGTGLGLYVCHNLIQALGGRIEVTSELGKGSSFRVILPDSDRRHLTRQ